MNHVAPSTARCDWVFTKPVVIFNSILWPVVSLVAVAVVTILASTLGGPQQTNIALGTGAVAFVAVVLITSARAKAKARAVLHTQPALPLERRVWISGYANGWPNDFDVNLWLEETGPDGPRVILQGGDGPPLADDPLKFEEIDIEPERARAHTRTWTARVVFIVAIAYAAIMLNLILTKGFIANLLLTSLVLLSFLVGLYAYGLLPVLRRVAMASIRKFEVTSLGHTRTFTRSDSVVLIAPWGNNGQREVNFLRQDRRRFQFHFTSEHDPALAKLLARWSHPAHTSPQPPSPHV